MEKLKEYLSHKKKITNYEETYSTISINKKDIKELFHIVFYILFTAFAFYLMTMLNTDLEKIAIENKFDFYDNGVFIAGKENVALVVNNFELFGETLKTGFLYIIGFLLSPLLINNKKIFMFLSVSALIFYFFAPAFYLSLSMSVLSYMIMVFICAFALVTLCIIFISMKLIKEKVFTYSKGLTIEKLKEELKKEKIENKKILNDLLDDNESMKYLLNIYDDPEKVKDFRRNELSFYISEEFTQKEFENIIISYRTKVQGFKTEKEFFLNVLNNNQENESEKEIELTNF